MKNLFIIPLFIMLLVLGCKEEKETAPPGSGTTGGAVSTPPFVTIKALPIIHNHEKASFEIETTAILSKVEFFFNNKSIGSTIAKPYSLIFTPIEFLTGEYDLTVLYSFENKEYRQSKKIKLELRKGDKLQGGRVFFLSPDNLHGLIASETDVSSPQTKRFNWGPAKFYGALNINEGQINTELIVKSINEGNNFLHWHRIDAYEVEGYKDWYVPSYNELNTLRENKQYVSNLTNRSDEDVYWSSTEIDVNTVYAKNLVSLMGEKVSKSFTYKFRLIHKF